MLRNLEKIYQNPIERLDVLFRSEPMSDGDESGEVHMYSLASQGEIDLHIIACGEDACSAIAYTPRGEMPVLSYDQVYLGRVSVDEAQQKLAELQQLTLDSFRQVL